MSGFQEITGYLNHSVRFFPPYHPTIPRDPGDKPTATDRFFQDHPHLASFLGQHDSAAVGHMRRARELMQEAISIKQEIESTQEAPTPNSKRNAAVIKLMSMMIANKLEFAAQEAEKAGNFGLAKVLYLDEVNWLSKQKNESALIEAYKNAARMHESFSEILYLRDEIDASATELMAGANIYRFIGEPSMALGCYDKARRLYEQAKSTDGVTFADQNYDATFNEVLAFSENHSFNLTSEAKIEEAVKNIAITARLYEGLAERKKGTPTEQSARDEQADWLLMAVRLSIGSASPHSNVSTNGKRRLIENSVLLAEKAASIKENLAADSSEARQLKGKALLLLERYRDAVREFVKAGGIEGQIPSEDIACRLLEQDKPDQAAIKFLEAAKVYWIIANAARGEGSHIIESAAKNAIKRNLRSRIFALTKDADDAIEKGIYLKAANCYISIYKTRRRLHENEGAASAIKRALLYIRYSIGSEEAASEKWTAILNSRTGPSGAELVEAAEYVRQWNNAREILGKLTKVAPSEITELKLLATFKAYVGLLVIRKGMSGREWHKTTWQNFFTLYERDLKLTEDQAELVSLRKFLLGLPEFRYLSAAELTAKAAQIRGQLMLMPPEARAATMASIGGNIGGNMANSEWLRGIIDCEKGFLATPDETRDTAGFGFLEDSRLNGGIEAFLKK